MCWFHYNGTGRFVSGAQRQLQGSENYIHIIHTSQNVRLPWLVLQEHLCFWHLWPPVLSSCLARLLIVLATCGFQLVQTAGDHDLW